MITYHAPRGGFTLKELFAVTFIIAALLFLCVLPFGRGGGAREAARRMQCTNNMKQMILGLYNYHDTFGRFPMAMGGTGAGGNENRLNGLVALLPFIEQSALYEEILASSPSGGPAPWDKNFLPWHLRLDTYRCPSDDNDGKDYQPTNYAFCIGDVTRDIHQLPKPRGAFAPGLFINLAEVTDGTSNTIAMTEIGTAHRRLLQGQYAINLPDTILDDPGICWRTADKGKQFYMDKVGLYDRGRGYNWVDGAAGPGLVNTILPPNSPSCAVGGEEAVDGVYSAGGLHPGGCLVSFTDGSVQLISQDVDAGDSAKAPPTIDDFAEKKFASPFGVWGALGTISGDENVDRNNL